MIADPANRDPRITRRHRLLLLVTSVMTCLLVAMGAIVCATESGTGCPDWPGCYGRIVPPPQIHSIIEYTHRLTAALTTPLILASTVLSWRRARSIRWVSRPLALSIVFLLAVIVFGALTVLTGLPRGLAAVDLGSALIVLALVLTATTVAHARANDPRLPDRLPSGSALSRLSLFALVLVFAVVVSGVLVAGKGSLTRCLGWPMWRVLPDDLAAGVQVARLVLAVLAGLSVVALVIQVWRTRQDSALRKAAIALAAAFFMEMLLGTILLVAGTSPYLLVGYVATATVLWALLVVVAVLASLAAASAKERISERANEVLR